MEFLSEVEQQVETFRSAYTITAGYDDWSTLQIVLCLLYVAVKHLYYIVCSWDILSYIVLYHFALIVLVEDFLLHHTIANCSHLWTVFRVYDSSDDATSECRTNLVELIFIVLIHHVALSVLHLHVERTDFQLSTVGSQT